MITKHSLGISKFIILFFMLFFIPVDTDATNLITYNFSGRIEKTYYTDDFTAVNGTPYSIADTFTGQFIYDLDAIGGPLPLTFPPFTDGSGKDYAFTSPPSGMRLTLNGDTFTSGSFFGSRIYNAGPNEPSYYDYLGFGGDYTSKWGFDAWRVLGLDFVGKNNDVLNSDALPRQINLSDWNQGLFDGYWYGITMEGSYATPDNKYNGLEINGIITSLTIVPEPTTMLLFGLGLLALTGVNRRKK